MSQNNDLISRREAIDAVSEYATIWMSYTDDMSASEIAEKALSAARDTMIRIMREQPAVQPDRDVIDDCLYHIHKNISVHTATGGVIAIRYYMEKLYEEIYGEEERPWWMTCIAEMHEGGRNEQT